MLIRPFAAEARKAHNMGFECRLNHEPKKRLVQVQMIPVRPSVASKLKLAAASAGHAGKDAIQVDQTYTLLEEPLLAMKTAIDTALEMAERALDGEPIG